MRRLLISGVLAVLVLASADRIAAQESKAAATTRKNLQQKVTLAVKEVGLKNFLEGDLNSDLDKPLRFKIDNASGVSNNMKINFAGKNVTVEKVLSELADKYDFGYYVISNAANNREDGKIVIRKSSKGKERGYEAGKEPKKGARLVPHARSSDRLALGRIFNPSLWTTDGLETRPTAQRWESLVASPRCCYRPRGEMVPG